MTDKNVCANALVRSLSAISPLYMRGRTSTDISGALANIKMCDEAILFPLGLQRGVERDFLAPGRPCHV
jgi:hypothetical protein